MTQKILTIMEGNGRKAVISSRDSGYFTQYFVELFIGDRQIQRIPAVSEQVAEDLGDDFIHEPTTGKPTLLNE